MIDLKLDFFWRANLIEYCIVYRAFPVVKLRVVFSLSLLVDVT
jgi:hypothetical protein